MTEIQIRPDELLQDLRNNKSKYKKIANKLFKDGKTTTHIAGKLGWTENDTKYIKAIKGATELIRRELLQFETWEQYNKERLKIKTKKIYDSGYTPKRKKQIKLRDGNKCVICKSDERLYVHHIDKNSTNNTEENLITICKHLFFLFQRCQRKPFEHREARQYVDYINARQEYFKKILNWESCDHGTMIITLKNVK